MMATSLEKYVRMKVVVRIIVYISDISHGKSRPTPSQLPDW